MEVIFQGVSLESGSISVDQSVVCMYEGDKGCLHCDQLQLFIVAELGMCGLWWWEDVV